MTEYYYFTKNKKLASVSNEDQAKQLIRKGIPVFTSLVDLLDNTLKIFMKKAITNEENTDCFDGIFNALK